MSKQLHQVYADGLRTASPGQTLRFNLPTDPGKFLDTTNSYFTFDAQFFYDGTTAATNTVSTPELVFTLTGSPLAQDDISNPYALPSANAAIPFGGITSLIRMVRLVSRGAIVEEIDNYAMLSNIVKEVTCDEDELRTRGFISGDYPHGVDYQSKFANRVQMFSSRGSASGSNSIRRFAFKLDQLGFFRSQHYLPLEWLPVTIELIFHQPAQCMTNAWTVAASPAIGGSYTPSFTITEPTFHAQLLQFNSEYTSAVNNKVLSF